MKDIENQNKSSVNQFSKGLSTDTSPIAQPEGTLRFALNAVDESEIGDSLFPGNAESNEVAGNFKEGYIAIGKVYMQNRNTAVFSVRPNPNPNLPNTSEIGIYSDSGVYETSVNDAESSLEDKLNFSVTHQIDAIYRLRRGCDDTVYWTDNLNPVRTYIFNRPEDFLSDEKFSAKKTSLFTRFEKTPKIQNLSVKSEGNLLPGSYNIAIQYLDSDLNPTEWITTSETIIIYNDSINDSFGIVRGSTNEKNIAYDFPVTNKSIHITYTNLDDIYPFVRLALIEATNGSGNVSKVTATLELPVNNGSVKYIFTGDNTFTTFPVEEIAQAPMIIDRAQSVEQVENRLILGNLTYKNNNVCELQEKASAIGFDFVNQEVILDNLTIPGNSKRPTANNEFVGYMPGEIYSFGIVYVFNDGTTSPVYHIPGNKEIASNYVSRGNCETKYWGDLEGKPVRHFQFPERDVNTPLVTKALKNIPYVQYTTLKPVLSFTSGHSLTLPLEDFNPAERPWNNPKFWVSIYINNGVYYSPINVVYTNIDKNTGVVDTAYLITQLSKLLDDDIGILHIYGVAMGIVDGDYAKQVFRNEKTVTEDVGTVYKYNIKIAFEENEVMGTKTMEVKTSKVFGIKFKNIHLPDGATGYYIVRNKRQDADRTVLDSGVLLPVINATNKKMYNSFGNIIPTYDTSVTTVTGTAAEGGDNSIRKDAYCLIYPEFLFNKKEYENFSLEKQGDFVVDKHNIVLGMTRDVMAGTSYNPKIHAKNSEEDPNITDAKNQDGFDLRTVIKSRSFTYADYPETDKDISSKEIKNLKYIKALSSLVLDNTDSEQTFYNICSDNNIVFFQLEKEKTIFDEDIDNSLDRTAFDMTLGLGAGIAQKFGVNSEHKAYDQALAGINTTAEEAILDADDITYASKRFGSIPGNWLKKYPLYYLKRKSVNPYTDFQQRPYINISNTVLTGTEATVFGGDSYVVPLTYFTSYFQDIKFANRKKKNNVWLNIAAIAIIAAGAVGSVFTAGATGVLAAAALTAIGVGAAISTAAVVIEQNKIGEIYDKKYRDGLNETIKDSQNDVLFEKSYLQNDEETYRNYWSNDDEVQWAGNILEDLWFETSVNINWRFGNTKGLTDFLNPTTNLSDSQMRNYFINKLTVIDVDNENGRLYTGYALSEQYNFNKDYARRNEEKPLFALGVEYDCCSDCIEKFTHRVHYSEQSFQEELTDNYKIFLPNNYRDIDGETGEIMNIFKIQNNLYIHTREGLWNLPKNYQERITDQIVSFIGTGSYFEIPPQKIVDDDTGNSYGTYHKWSRLKTPYGYFFVCESQNAICQFTGNKVTAISSQGMYYWFYNNIPMDDANIKDNPSNPNGSGFIGVYDSKKELIIYTKKHLVGNINKSWTVSYNLKKGTWGSFHSFLPYFYIQTPQYYFSLLEGNKNIWRHNVLGKYQEYYGIKKPFIIEYVISENPLINKLFENFTVFVETKKYNATTETFYDIPNIFFDKLLCYNSRQSSGVMDIIVKDKSDMDFLNTQVHNPLTSVIADRNERNWTLNDLRDMSKGTNTPLFIEKLDSAAIQQDYFIDKVVNPDAINNLKEWYDIESFRDKYLVVRLTFNKFAEDIKMITNFTVSNETISSR